MNQLIWKGGAGLDFRQQVRALIEDQLLTWPMLRDAVAGLEVVRYREFEIRGSRVLAQYNPGRIVSAVAKVDAETIRNRPCFLCEENLPPEERGIEFGNDYIVLCNPYPILKDHLVIASREHTPQTVVGNFELLLALAESLGPGWISIYNGPKCGASAPDHMHFQACSSELFPITEDLKNWEQEHEKSFGASRHFALSNYRINVLVAQGAVRDDLVGWFYSLVSELAGISEAPDEPLINLAVIHDGENWVVLIYPRQKHRPSCYFAEGDEKLTVSPAAVDLSGILIVPEPEHYERISGRDIEDIFDEVMLDTDLFQELIQRMNQR